MSPRRLIVSLLVAAASIGVPPSVARADLPAAPTWSACEASPGFQCATLKAPLDYGEPTGPQIDLALIRKPATDPTHRKGALFTNGGGPGGASNASLPVVYPLLSQRLRAHFDIVGFDPRGIGKSTQLRCFDTPEQENALLGQLPPAGFPSDRREEQLFVSVYRQFAEACAQRGGPIQYHMGTADVARDMDRIRAAIGEPKLDYYGPSYGTYLGATYANLFPDTVGRIVLDGNVPPVQWNDAAAGARDNTFVRLQSPLGTEIGLRMFLRECGRVTADRCAFSAGAPRATRGKYRELLHRLRAKPVSLDGIEYTPALITGTVGGRLALVRANAAGPGWKQLAEILQTVWQATGPKPLAKRAQRNLGRRMSAPKRAPLAEFDLGLLEGTVGVLCGESPNPADPFSYVPQAKRADATQSPLGGFGDVWTWLAGPCASWKARDQDTYAGPFNRRTPPILLVGTLADPNTAYTGTLRMARQLSNTRVLTETGSGHTALLNKSRCVDDYLDAYFERGALPRRATLCDQDEAPF